MGARVVLPEVSVKKVVVIDDDPRLARLLGELLEHEGYETMALTDSRDAVGLIAGWGPDLIILDILMPAVSGWDLLKELKASRNTRDVPVIVHSASERECANVVELSRYDDVLVLPKPWDLDDLVTRVRELTAGASV